MIARTSWWTFLLLYLVHSASYSVRALDCGCGGTEDFTLRHIGSTKIQIGLAWEDVPEAAGYTVERGVSCNFPPYGTLAADETGVNNGNYVGGYTRGMPGALENDANTAVRFDGQTGLVNGGSDPSIDFSYKENGLTLEAWVKPEAFASYNTILAKAETNGRAYYGLDYHKEGAELIRYFTGDGGWTISEFAYSLTVESWYHIALTHTATGTVTLWVNGTSQGQRLNTSTPVTPGVPVGIGSFNGLGALYPFQGLIDEVAIYNYPLSSTRLAAHYAARADGTYATQVLADGPMAYWRLDDAGDTVASYDLPPSVNVIGDTGRPVTDRYRFHVGAGTPPVAGLTPDQSYYYRVRAHMPDGSELFSSCQSAMLSSGPIRGISGDQFADVVLGQPNFGQNVYGKPNPGNSVLPGGVLVDKGVSPNRVYIVDSNNSRVLGFESVGNCTDGTSCTTDADCADDSACEVLRRCSDGAFCITNADCTDGSKCRTINQASIVLGQPSLIGSSGCNGNGTGQDFPDRAPATSASLCLIDPLQISVEEGIFGAEMDVDDSGAVYVPDLFNHRVLKFSDPFATDQLADDVWGQEDFNGNLCNRGGDVTKDSLCLTRGGGHSAVAIDQEGHLWVSDPGNARVLRFPRAAGSILHDADYVFGQSNCTSAVRRPFGSTSLSELAYPVGLAIDRDSRILYIADADDSGGNSRILRIELPSALPAQSSCSALPISASEVPAVSPCGERNYRIEVDPVTHHLWVGYSEQCAELLDVVTGSPHLTLRRIQFPDVNGPMRGIDVDQEGNIYTVDAYEGTYRVDRKLLESGSFAPVKVLAGSDDDGGLWTGDSFYHPWGVVILSDPAGIGQDQMVIGDRYRLLIWNEYHIDTIQNGEPADDVYGEPDFTARTGIGSRFFNFLQIQNRQLWLHVRDGTLNEIHAFDYPLTNSSVPSRKISLSSGFPVLGNQGVSLCFNGDELDFAFESSADAIWIADRWNSRVVRVNGLSGAPYIDVVLGQANAQDTQCNRGSPARRDADTLCIPYNVAIDAADNLFIADNGAETGTNQRILEFDASSFVPGVSALFGVPAVRVFGTGGDFKADGLLTATSDPIISPFKPVFHPEGFMVVGNNPYSTQRFPVVFTDPLNNQLPQMVLGDYVTYPAGGHSFDQYGNLYISDTNWSRVLIYKQPLIDLSFAPHDPSPTALPPSTATTV